MVRAVIFDLDNTLYSYDPLDKEAGERVREYTCKEIGITEEQYEEAYHFGRNETKRQLHDVGASHNRMLYFQKTLEYAAHLRCTRYIGGPFWRKWCCMRVQESLSTACTSTELR